MDSGGGGKASDCGSDGGQNALLESGGHQHEHQHPFEQSRDNGNHQNHHPVSTKIIIRKAIPFLIALALACFVLYQSSNHVQYYFPVSSNLLSRQSQNSTTQTCQSSPTSDERKFSGPTNLIPVYDNSSTTPAPEILPTNISSPMPPQENLPSSPSEETEEAKLQRVLNRAAMGNKIVIVTTVNAAWTEPNSLFDLFLESLKIGNETQKFLNHLVVIALDQKSYNRCSALHPYCYALKTEGADFSTHEAYFMRPDYVKLVWRKIEFMYTIIKLGYSSIFTDADIMWFRDPFLHFLEDADMQTSSDHYGGTPTSRDGITNTGFYYVKSNNRTIQFFEFWLSSRHKFPRNHDQQVFNMIRFDPLMEQIGIKIKLLDTAFYGGFCEQSKDLNVVCTMHANCCLGLGKKLHDLRMLIDDWKTYMALSSEERVNTTHTWTLPRKCH